MTRPPPALRWRPSGILPVYRGSTTVRSWVVTRSMSQVLAIVDDLADPIPEDVRRSAGLLGFGDAMRAIHAPADEQELAAAGRRFKFEEAFVLQIELLRRRAARRAVMQCRALPSAGVCGRPWSNGCRSP